MTARSPVGWRAAGLVGRRSECGVLDHLVDAVRVGESRTLVLCGEPGAGAFKRDQLGYGPFVVPELAEAASRTGDVALVRAALEWLSECTRRTPTDWVLGIEARVGALLSEGDTADRLYRESVDRLGHTRAAAHGPRTCSTRWACRRLPSGPGVSCGPRAKPLASARPRPVPS